MAEQQNLDMLAAPPAGISLTQDNTKYPWGKPPKHANPDDAMTTALDSLENPVTRENLLKMLLAGVSVESLVEGFIYSGFESGKFSLDTGLLMKAPLGLYIANIAEEEEVPYRLLENEDSLEEDKLDDVHVLKIMKQNNPRMFEFLKEKANEEIRMGGKPMEEDQKALSESFLTSEIPQGENV
tara:strand:+ start:762 stop:1310 length:549 start_codon:yes stop_codon:yes gene_type:complete